MPNTQPSEVVRLNSSSELVYYKSPVGRLTLPKMAVGIKEEALMNNPDIKYLNTCNAKYIDKRALAHCNNLEEVDLMYNLKKIGSSAFQGCEKLQEIVIPENVEEIGDAAFHYCSHMTYAWVDTKHLDTLPAYCFSFCRELKKASLDDSIKLILEFAFQYCEALEKIYLPAELTEIGREAFKSCVKLTQIAIPNKVAYIDSGAFYGCKNLTRVNLKAFKGDTLLENIGNYAFSDTNVVEITIPKSVKALGDGAFDNCSNLVQVTFESDDQLAILNNLESIFDRCNKLAVIDFPSFTFRRAINEKSWEIFNK